MRRHLLLMIGLLAPATAMASPPTSSNGFLRTIGVVTHMAYTDGEYANVPYVIQSLQYLGIAQVRDGISNGRDAISGQNNGSASLSVYTQLAAAGVKFTFLTVVGGAITTSVLNNQLSLMQQVEAATPGSVVAIEGPNEINNWPVTWNGASDATCAQELADALALQGALYTAVKQNAVLQNASVVMFTGANAYLTADGCSLADHPNVGAVGGYADFDNQHPYPPNDSAPNAAMNPAYTVAGNTGRLVFTETGYSSSGGTNAGVNEYVQCMYGLDLFFDAASYGVTRTYWYNLLDAYAPGSPQGDDYYGLFDYQGNPKPLAVSLHNLMAIMADDGERLLRTPRFTVTGLPTAGYTMALGRRDGSSGDFVLWAEPTLWNRTTGKQLQPTAARVTVNLGRTYRKVRVYDPTVGTSPVQTRLASSHIVVTLTDHPLIVRAE